MKNDLGQLFIIGLKGKDLAADEEKFLVEEHIGGVILFDRNIESPQQVHDLCSRIQGLRHGSSSQTPFYISIDMEGGRVARLKAPFTQWPPLEKVGSLESANFAFQYAKSMGEELKAVGINLDYAPSLDVLTNPKNEIIGDRALSTDPEVVSKIGSALVRGYIKSGVSPCAKHFPGHGNTLLDSHEALPVEEVSLETLQGRELIPFKQVFRARLEMLMTAHITFSALDPEWPVTLSEKVLKGFLREELKYKKLILSDDLDMKALSLNYEADFIPVQALKAGCDIALYCNDPEKPPQALEAVRKALADGGLDEADMKEKLKRVSDHKRQYLTKPDPVDFKEASKMIGHPDHLKISKAAAEGQLPDDLRT